MTITVEGAAEIRARFDRVASPQTKRRLLMKLAGKVISNSKARVRAQTDLNDNRWTPKKSNRSKRMLIRTGQTLKQVYVDTTEARVGWSSYKAEQIAAKHQFGYTENFTAGKARNSPRAKKYNDPATRRQASALLDAGFKIRLPGGGRKTPTKKWITEHMTMGQAGLVLKKLRVEIKNHWQTVLPPRSFLGVQNSELPVLNEIALNEMQSAIGI